MAEDEEHIEWDLSINVDGQPIKLRTAAEVRKFLNIPEPTQYRECHRIWAEEGIDPYNLLASENAPKELVSA